MKSESELKSVIFPNIWKELKKNVLFGGMIDELKISRQDRKFKEVKVDLLPLYGIEDEFAKISQKIIETLEGERYAKKILSLEPHKVWCYLNEYIFEISGESRIFFSDVFLEDNNVKEITDLKNKLWKFIKEKEKRYTTESFIRILEFNKVLDSLNKIFEEYGIKVVLDKKTTKRNVKIYNDMIGLSFTIQCIFKRNKSW